MTCIVAYKSENTIYMGGDSAGVISDNISYRADEKVFINGPMLFGFTDSFRMGQILRYHLKVPHHPIEKDDLNYLCTNFIDAVVETLDRKGYGNVSNGRKSGGTFLIGYHGNIYTIYSDYQVALTNEAYAAIGCGANYAKGCLYMNSGWDAIQPYDKVIYALGAANYHSAWVSQPYVVKQINF